MNQVRQSDQSWLGIICEDLGSHLFILQIKSNRRQPIAGLWPTFRLALPEGQLLGVQGLARGRCFFSYIHPNATTHGPPTSSARPGQPRELFADHQSFPANQVRGATASGFFKFNLGLHARIVNGAGRKCRGGGRPLRLPRAVLNELGLSLKAWRFRV